MQTKQLFKMLAVGSAFIFISLYTSSKAIAQDRSLDKKEIKQEDKAILSDQKQLNKDTKILNKDERKNEKNPNMEDQQRINNDNKVIRDDQSNLNRDKNQKDANMGELKKEKATK